MARKSFGVLGVVGEDVRGKLDFAASLADPLAHLQRHGMRQCLGLFVHQNGCPGHDHRALGIGLSPPRLEALSCGSQLFFELLVGELVELLEELAGGGIEALIGHEILFRCFRRFSRYVRQASMITLSALVLAALPNVS